MRKELDHAEKYLTESRALLDAETRRGQALIVEAEQALRRTELVLPQEIRTRQAQLKVAEVEARASSSRMPAGTSSGGERSRHEGRMRPEGDEPAPIT